MPFDILYGISKENILIPYYHMVSDEDVLHIKHLYPHKNIKQFTEDLDFILKKFSPVGLNDVLQCFHHKKALPPKALHLTFDDGFREIHDIIAPILFRKGIPATFFVSSGFTDNKILCHQHKASLLVEQILKKDYSSNIKNGINNILTGNNPEFRDVATGILSVKYRDKSLIDQIADLMNVNFSDYLLKTKPYLTTEHIRKLIGDGFTIGAHSIDHPLYADLSLEEQLRQTMESTAFLKEKFKLNYGVFAFPHSDHGVSRQYYSRIKESNLIDLSFGTSNMMEDVVQDNVQRFSLEKPLWPAKNIIALQYAKRFWRMAKGQNRIHRH